MVETRTGETDTEGEERQEEKECLAVLTGLEKYAKDHVLLVGRPGAGKSTALIRFLLELANKALDSAAAPIPVLVELRFYHESCEGLIREFLQRHGVGLELPEIESLLAQGRLLLLIDGLNELPSEAARRDVKRFRQQYRQGCSMVFTTRDLGAGGDLEIERKLEMQPLTEKQMQEFVKAYLPDRGEQFLRQLGGRLQELGRTPLLLWMLCSVFVQTGNRLPRNWGEMLRRFVQVYSGRLKEDVPVKDESRRWWEAMLRRLAWVMTTEGEKTELRVTIEKREAEQVLREYLTEQEVPDAGGCAKIWLEDLLKHHLLQVEAGEHLAFRHQMIQEYYAAEELLERLPELSDEEFKQEYLNYLKWTEAIALMLGLLRDEKQALRAIELAKEVDLCLAARLSGKVLPAF